MKRWTIDEEGDLWWSTGPKDWLAARSMDATDLGRALGSTPAPELDDAFAGLVVAVRDAGRLRGLAATFSSHLNAQQTFTGAQVAAMLNSKAEVL